MKRSAYKTNKICAFCRYWYDPSGSAIYPKYGGFYEYEDSIERPCSKYGNLEKPAWSSCNHFSSKL